MTKPGVTFLFGPSRNRPSDALEGDIIIMLSPHHAQLTGNNSGRTRGTNAPYRRSTGGGIKAHTHVRCISLSLSLL
jgi:hypothetical protein